MAPSKTLLFFVTAVALLSCIHCQMFNLNPCDSSTSKDDICNIITPMTDEGTCQGADASINSALRIDGVIRPNRCLGDIVSAVKQGKPVLAGCTGRQLDPLFGQERLGDYDLGLYANGKLLSQVPLPKTQNFIPLSYQITESDLPNIRNRFDCLFNTTNLENCGNTPEVCDGACNPIIDNGTPDVTDPVVQATPIIRLFVNNIRIGQSLCVFSLTHSLVDNPVTINCTATNNVRVDSYAWTKDGQPFSGSGGTITVTEIGTYVCTAMNECGTDSATSTIYITPPPRITTQTNFSCLTNGTLTLTCVTNQSITWYRNGQQLSTTERSIVAASNDIGATYSCVVNDATCGESSDNITIQEQIFLNSTFPQIPRIVFNQDRIQIGQSLCLVGSFSAPPSGDLPSAVTLFCNVSDPDTSDGLNYRWTFNFVDQNVNQHFFVANRQGIYMCEVSNICGKDIADSSVRSQSTMFNIMLSCTASSSQSLTLTCSVSPPQPNLTITWLRNGVAVSRMNESIVTTASDANANYTCALGNDLCGTVRYEDIIVPAPPRAIMSATYPGLSGNGCPPPSTSDKVCAPMGTQVTISCSQSFGSTYTISFTPFGGGESREVSRDQSITVTAGQSTFGNYTCEVRTSECGNGFSFILLDFAGCVAANVSLDLTRNGVPVNDRCSSNLMGLIQSMIDVVLSCDPMPDQRENVTWYRNGVAIDKPHSFSLTEQEASGEYRCVVDGLCLNFTDTINIPSERPNITCGSGVAVSPNEVVTVGQTVCFTEINSFVLIRCDVNNNASSVPYNISWLVNGTDVGFSGNVYNATRIGTYVCRVENDCGFMEKNTTVAVKPQIRKGRGDNNTMMVDIGGNACLGDGLMIICDLVIGFDSFRTWYKDGEVLVGQTERKLTLNSTDTGRNYTCVATSHCGTDSATTLVRRDHAVSLDPVVSLSSPEGSRCQQLKRPPPGPVYCAFLGDRLTIECTTNETLSTLLIYPDGTSSRRVFSPVMVSNAGMYLCNSTNECGLAEDIFNLTVWDPARIKRRSPLPPGGENEVVGGAGRSLEKLCIPRDGSLKLHCCVTGIDQPVTNWSRILEDGTIVPINLTDPSISIDRTDPLNPILCISPYMARHEGKYLCETTNNPGNDSGIVDTKIVIPMCDWSCDRWGKCSHDCHRGIRNRTVQCIDVHTREPCPEFACDNTTRPDSEELCTHLGACAKWDCGDWSECSATCGGGYRIRSVTCKEIHPDAECDANARPRSFESCNTQSCCADMLGSFCRLIANTDLCWREYFSRVCCWTCSSSK